VLVQVLKQRLALRSRNILIAGELITSRIQRRLRWIRDPEMNSLRRGMIR
jgi:hypothetical protein